MSIDKDLSGPLDGRPLAQRPVWQRTGILAELTKALAERALRHGDGRSSWMKSAQRKRPRARTSPPNRRNGRSQKTVTTRQRQGGSGHFPRGDRNGTFDPLLIAKVSAPFPGIRSQDRQHVCPRHDHPRNPGAYRRNLRRRGIAQSDLCDHRRGHGLRSPPGRTALWSPAIRSSSWTRSESISVSDGAVSNKAVFVALAVLPDGTRDVLGLWFQANEGAKFWAKVLSDLRNRGVQDILIAVVDGLKGFPQAIEAAFPQTRIQTCIVHLLRHSMNFASYKDRKAVAAALKAIYTAVDADAAELALAEFEDSDLAKRYPAIAPSWRRAWNEVIPFLDYPPEVRKLIYTTNAIEALNSKIRRAVRTRGHFPSDDAAAKLIYLALNATSTEWKRSVREWHAVRSQLAIMFEDRFPMA